MTEGKVVTSSEASAKPAAKSGFLSSLFMAAATGVATYAIFKLFAGQPDPMLAAGVAMASGGILAGAVAPTKNAGGFEPFMFVLGGMGGLILTGLMGGAGLVIAGSIGAGVGAVAAGFSIAGMAASGADCDKSPSRVFAGLATGMILSATLAFSTASLPGFSLKLPDKTAVQTMQPAPPP